MVTLLVPQAESADPPWVQRSSAGMVASDSVEASELGAKILREGGNAFDAAVATSFALGITRPHSTGLGGGGFMVAYVAAEDRVVALDFRETAPATATPQRYADLKRAAGVGPSPSIYGGNAVGVPGQVAGLAEISRRFGTRTFAQLARAAAELAERGFVVDESYEEATAGMLRQFERHPEWIRAFGPIYRIVLGAERAHFVGELVRRPDLARTLQSLAEAGPSWFYEGEIAAAIVRAVNDAGGALSIDDLRAYRVRQRQPVRTNYRGFEIVSMPLPSSGGICLAQMLDGLGRLSPENLTVSGDDQHGALRPLIESLKHAFADRSRYLGDPDFSDFPWRELLTAPGVPAQPLGDLEAYGHPGLEPVRGATIPPDDRGTSHFCVADRFGNVVSLTETINGEFGSLVLVEPYGIILNNQMDDFLTVRGEANLFGLVQGEANLVAPGKRPLSSMTPTIVLREGKPVLVLGASGGPRIISSVLQVMLNVLEFNLPLEDAVRRTRVHHQWKPDVVYTDRDPDEAMRAWFERAGYTLADERRGAVVQAIQFLPSGVLVGASDPRKGGKPAAP